MVGFLASVDGKSSALIVDIFDQKPYLNEHSENRLQAYVDKVGEENIIILDYKDPEFIADIEYIIEGTILMNNDDIKITIIELYEKKSTKAKWKPKI